MPGTLLATRIADDFARNLFAANELKAIAPSMCSMRPLPPEVRSEESGGDSAPAQSAGASPADKSKKRDMSHSVEHTRRFRRLRFLAALAAPAIILALAIAATEWLSQGPSTSDPPTIASAPY